MDGTPVDDKEQKRIERNKKNTDRIKKLYHDNEDFRNKMKENSKKRYALMKEAMSKAMSAGLISS